MFYKLNGVVFDNLFEKECPNSCTYTVITIIPVLMSQFIFIAMILFLVMNLNIVSDTLSKSTSLFFKTTYLCYICLFLQ